MEKPNQKKPKGAKKKKQYKPPKGLSKEELEKRLKQRDQALNRKFHALSSPQLRPVLMGAQTKLAGAEETLRALIDPDNAPPMRLPGGGKPTFVVKLRAVLPAAVVPEAALATVPELKQNCGFAIKRRDPRCSLICSVYNANPSSTYLCKGPSGSTLLACNNDGNPLFGIAQYSSGYERHGEYYLPWILADGLTRLWYQNEPATPSLIILQGGDFAALTDYTIRYDIMLNGNHATGVQTVTSDADGIAIFGATFPQMAGYITFTVINTVVTNILLNFLCILNDKSKCGVRHLAAPRFWENISDIDSIRSNACSLMYSDRTAANYSQGDICSYQASGGDPWEKMLGANDPLSFIGLDPYGQVPSFQDGFKGPYKKGKYIPLKFLDDPREHQMFNITDASDPWELPPVVLANQTDYLYIGFNFGLSQAAGAYPMGEWTAVEGNEGETDSQWRETKVPGRHPDVLKEAKWCFSQVKCDFENPSHLSKIWSWVKQNAPHILEGIGRAVGNAGGYGAAASAGLGGAAQVIRLIP